MRPSEIDRVVLLSDDDYAAELSALKATVRRAYQTYCGAGTVNVGGLYRATGHGSFVCDLSPNGEQEAWQAAERRLSELRAARESWRLVSVAGGEAVYETTVALVPSDFHGCTLRHRITVATHGADVSACGTPTEAIRRVRVPVGSHR